MLDAALTFFALLWFATALRLAVILCGIIVWDKVKAKLEDWRI
jgi:hypothetical protein